MENQDKKNLDELKLIDESIKEVETQLYEALIDKTIEKIQIKPPDEQEIRLIQAFNATSCQTQNEKYLIEQAESEAQVKTLQYKNDLLRLQNADFRQSTRFRRFLTKKLLSLTQKWMFFIGVIILLNGFKVDGFSWWGVNFGFEWNDNVIMTLLATTTATIVGLFATVTMHFFYKQDKK